MLRIFLSIGATLVFTAASAQVHAQPPTAHGTKLHRERDARDLQALQAAKVPLAQAVTITEAKSQGRAIAAAFEVEQDTPQYEIKTLGADGKLVDHHVEANSGQVTGSESQPVETLLNRLKPDELRAQGKTMAQAIEAAEARTGGRAASAQLIQESLGMRYTVNVIAGDRSHTVTVRMDGETEVVAD
jgi:uncharacterized membrane protein YkoI